MPQYLPAFVPGGTFFFPPWVINGFVGKFLAF
jgi:hypothetical protein